MQTVADDLWSSINMFESKKVESSSSPSTNDLKYGRLHQQSNQLKLKHQVNNKKEIKKIYKWLKKENKRKIPKMYQNIKQISQKIWESQKYYEYWDLKIWGGKYLKIIKNKMFN